MNQPVIVASGLPRSGTSMLMQMLQAGGLPVVTDAARAPDEDNPRGYFEDDRVKRLAQDAAWIEEARGKALKVVSPLLQELPQGPRYAVLFMRRDLREVLASQARMLERRGAAAGESYQNLSGRMRAHLREVERMLHSRPDMAPLFLDHAETLRDPLCAARSIRDFLAPRLGLGLDVEAMAAAVDPALRRQRSEDLASGSQTVPLHVPRPLYERLAQAASSAGLDDVSEFAALLLEQGLDPAPSGAGDGPGGDDQAIRKRLESLGYL